MEIGEGERHAHLKTAHLTLLSPSDNGKITLFASQAHVAKNHVARAGLDELAVHKKNSMMTKSWLLDGQIKEVKAKLKGFESVDPVRCDAWCVSFARSCQDRLGQRWMCCKIGVISSVDAMHLQIPESRKRVRRDLR